eukprot:6105803-Pyramimonas_sp.AAC.1
MVTRSSNCAVRSRRPPEIFKRNCPMGWRAQLSGALSHLLAPSLGYTSGGNTTIHHLTLMQICSAEQRPCEHERRGSLGYLPSIVRDVKFVLQEEESRSEAGCGRCLMAMMQAQLRSEERSSCSKVPQLLRPQVDVQFVRKMRRFVGLEELKREEHREALGGMTLLRRARLSVQPVTTAEWDYIVNVLEQSEESSTGGADSS